MQLRQLALLLALCCCARSGASSQAASTTQPQQQQKTTTTTTTTTTAATGPAPPPVFCKTGDGAAYPQADAPSSMSWGGNMLKVYHNLYHHNKKWYAVLDGRSNASSIDAGVSANTQLVKLPTTDSKGFQENIQVCFVPGVTLFIDFPFPAFPDNLGHWAELLLPTFSIFSNPSWRQHLQSSHQHIHRLLLPNVRPELLYNWPKEMLALSLDPALPPWPPVAATDGAAAAADAAAAAAAKAPVGAVPWDKPLPMLLGEASIKEYCARGWMLFENVVVIQDRYPILAMPDRTLPQPPADAACQLQAAAAAAAAAAGMEVAAAAAGMEVAAAAEGMETAAAAAAAGIEAAAAAAGMEVAAAAEGGIEVAAEAEGMEAAAAAAGGGGAALWQGFWKMEQQVGFNRPGLAEQFRAAAFARQLWGPPLQQHTSGSSSKIGSDQQQLVGASIVPQAAAAAATAAVPPGLSSSSSSSRSSSSTARVQNQIPRVVTVLLYPEDYPPVVNHYALVDMLRDLTEPYGFKVRTVSLTMGAPFLSHMATVAGSGLIIARHGPLLASAMLLPPGAAVLELLPYKWEWRSVSSLYYNMTQSTGYLHHWAWRPLDAKWCRYKEPAHVRYAGWTTSECHGRECLMVHAQAGLEVDTAAVRQLLSRKLPGLLEGQSVAQLREPWPPAD